jgi:mono/diheme cytochrome c family protein
VLMKEFSLAGKRLETRLFMRHPDGQWAGYTYKWSDDESDAMLLPGAETQAIGNQTWLYPSRDQCLECHTDAAGRALGPELAQLDKDFRYGDRISNELATWDHIGLFDAPLPSPLPSPLPAIDSSAPAEARARAYLHANCSFCHRPNGTGRGPADFRYATPFAMMGVCNADPTQGNLGVMNAKLLAPGHPESSIMSVRMHATGVNRMPPLATRVVDAAGAKAVDDWIASLTSCN